MDRDEMLRLFEAHRDAEAARMAGETIYFDLATFCEQAGLSVERVRAGAKARAAGGSASPAG